MHLLLAKMLTLTTSGMHIIYRVTPMMIQVTAGGSDQLLSSVVGGTLVLIRPVIRKSAALLRKTDQKVLRFMIPFRISGAF